MDIQFDKVQQGIVNEARRFLEKECPIDYVREMYEDEKGFTNEFWSKMSALDWLKIRIPEEYEGLGMEQIDLHVLLEEMGRALMPGPFFSTAILAAEAIMQAGSDSQKKSYLPEIASGEKKGTLAFQEPEDGTGFYSVRMEARPDGASFIINGTKLFVFDAYVADFVICAARTATSEDLSQGVTLFMVNLDRSDISVSSLPIMDKTRRLYSVDFKDLRVGKDMILGEFNKGGQALHHALKRARLAICADSIGGAQKVLEVTTNYAKTRIQFDRPIGSFQVIKHKCARMMADIEAAKSLAYYAAWAVDNLNDFESEIAVSAAKAYCNDAYRNAATNAIQIHGAMGVTWENDMHLYLKRSKMNECQFGDTPYHREHIARLYEY